MHNLWAKGVAIYKSHREAWDYLFWGVMATALNIVLLPVFMALGMSTSSANLLDLCICILFAYCTNRAFVFRSLPGAAQPCGSFCRFWQAAPSPV